MNQIQGCLQQSDYLKIVPVPSQGNMWSFEPEASQPPRSLSGYPVLRQSIIVSPRRVFTSIPDIGIVPHHGQQHPTRSRCRGRRIRGVRCGTSSHEDKENDSASADHDLLLRTSQLQTEISSNEAEEEEAERQDATHLTYITRAELRGRSSVHVGVNVAPGQDPPVPSPSPSETLRREQPTDRQHHSASQGVVGTTAAKNLDDNQETPDTWIDLYSAGRLPPAVAVHSTRSVVSAELEPFDGKALEWFSWIDLFRALVHDTPKSPGEKLALLKRFLRGDCLDLVYGLGGGESAYVEALVRLKQTCGRRDFMRAAHHQAIQRIEAKQDPASFKRFAERIRTHLFDLSRIGETGTTDLIEKICLKLQLPDRLAWNEERRGRIEDRSLNAYGMWLCSRTSAYQNAFSIAADQVNPISANQ
ncbi:hypothetical protein OUZ56_012215 [Daphnia magna]|uniref:Uncharacterized protein n=1 Tax=Daphnia magna TaxID=35525 RepID=A0ABQ9Z2J8_9CRUS|nr:hypothetical protein OUZ56_012215 [Daphnia magna]